MENSNFAEKRWRIPGDRSPEHILFKPGAALTLVLLPYLLYLEEISPSLLSAPETILDIVIIFALLFLIPVIFLNFEPDLNTEWRHKRLKGFFIMLHIFYFPFAFILSLIFIAI